MLKEFYILKRETVMINNLSKLDNIGKVKALVTEK